MATYQTLIANKALKWTNKAVTAIAKDAKPRAVIICPLAWR